ncbi:MAG: cytochrome c biogenesis protein CcsA [Candidatus Aureabacteria bacterium]|nr:cytochrome c biogenesis protein CcsA [Candidatus Auribacterota bacterium]
MMHLQSVNIALVFYSVACVTGIFYLLNRSVALFRISVLFATGGFASLSLAISCRWIEAGHSPLTSMYETLVFFAWASWFVALVIVLPRGMRELLVLIPFVSVVCLGYASTLDASIRPLFPALRSNWLTIHVAACFLGYAGFAMGFITGIGLAISLWLKRPVKKWENSSVVCIRFGFIFLTYGILTGSVWANEAWTTYWGWDSKEIWALLTWILYFSLLMLRSKEQKDGKLIKKLPFLTALFTIGGFFFVLFTYFGVSYLLKGLHSYL